MVSSFMTADAAFAMVESNQRSPQLLASSGQLPPSPYQNVREKVEKETIVYSPPPIKKASTDRSMKLVDDLNSLNAKMYGAYWCSHCYNQKETLGKEAVEKFTYIECDKEGLSSQYGMCRAKDIPGYPTWEIKGKLYPGEKSLDELEQLVAKVKSGSE
jgi:hypothetical protein